MLDKILSVASANPITAIGKVLDQLFTSDEEKLSKQVLLEKLRQQPALAQSEINKIEAQHRSLFVAGWRPFIGWICGLGLFYDLLARPVVIILGFSAPGIESPALHTLLLALLGLGTLRSVEKYTGRAK